MSLFIGAALLAGAVVLFLLHPMLTGERAPMRGEEDEPTEAESQRRVTLRALRDVEYDFVTGKLDEADYQALRRELSAEALSAMDAESAERGGRERDPDALERTIASVRQGLSSGRTCGGCGHLNAAGSRFCGSCGSPLAAPSGGGAERIPSARTAGGRGPA